MIEFPGGKRFALAIVDDTDDATVENVSPIYELLAQLGLRSTKTVWPTACDEGGGSFSGSQTLENKDYLAFAKDLQAQGFELTWHGPTMQSSTRERILAGLSRFRDVFGTFPHMHINHAGNRDNIYWGVHRFDDPMLRFLLRRVYKAEDSEGHIEGSPYWWGDRCVEHVIYARNLTFNGLDLRRVNPTMPYRDPRRPLVPFWFSAVDAGSAEDFAHVLRSNQQEKLERAGGFSILATHFGRGFVRNGQVVPEVRKCLTELSARNGWFPNAGELLDWLRTRNGANTLPAFEWRRMQWLWARDVVVRKLRARMRKRKNKRSKRS